MKQFDLRNWLKKQSEEMRLDIEEGSKVVVLIKKKQNRIPYMEMQIN